MDRRVILIYATCQGDFLSRILKCSILAQYYDIQYIANYEGPGIPRPMRCADELIKKCVCLLYHPVKNEDGAQSIADVRKKLDKRSLVLPVPYITSNLYWPLFLDIHSPIGLSAQDVFGVLPYSSPVLDKIIEMEPDVKKIIKLWNSFHPSKLVDIPALTQKTFENWDNVERNSEGWLGVNTFLKNNWRKNLLFYVCNHPSKEVLLYIANKLLDIFSVDRLTLDDIKDVECGQSSIYPINRITALHLGLKFIKGTSNFLYKNKIYTSDEWVEFYVECYKKYSGT